LLKIIANLCNRRYVYFLRPLVYLIKKPPVPTKREKISLSKGKSCNVLLLRMLLLRTSIYLKSVLRHKFLILHTYRLREQGYEDPWLLFDAKRSLRAKYFGEILIQTIMGLSVRYRVYQGLHNSSCTFCEVRSNRSSARSNLKSPWVGGVRFVEKCVTIGNFVCLVTDKTHHLTAPRC